MTRLSVAVIARDEARYIGGCLRSVQQLADEIVVLLDDRTRDETAAIARKCGARVELAAWLGFPAQRNLALERCRGEWVLFLDADEEASPALADEVRVLLRADSLHDGYWIPRYNLFFGRALRGGGWYPDHQLRLLRRSAARYDETRLVHEFAALSGTTARLKEHIIHHNIAGLGELWRKQRGYALAEAQTLYLQGQRARRRNFVARPLREFVRRYLVLGGWRDGGLGLLLCGTLAWFELVKFAHLKGIEIAHQRAKP
jgi:glycosyltransferase involved in cell wall biosynthesis